MVSVSQAMLYQGRRGASAYAREQAICLEITTEILAKAIEYATDPRTEGAQGNDVAAHSSKWKIAKNCAGERRLSV